MGATIDSVTIRAFDSRDYYALAEVVALVEGDNHHDADWYRRRDASWNPTLLRLRLVAERDGQVVGWGQVAHMWWMYHPRKFKLDLNVDPNVQRQGIGSLLYSQLIGALEADWNPLLIGAEVRDSSLRGIAFLEHRGFHEAHRRWHARLLVEQANTERATEASLLPAQLGLTVTTIAEERRRRGELILRELYEFEQQLYQDEPGHDPEGVLPFDQFLANEMHADIAVDEGSYLALDGDRFVGISRLQRDVGEPRGLHVGFTGIASAYRGHGIALALKLRTIQYARDNGYDEITTQNDSTNAAMLHINQQLGFELTRSTLVFEKRFDAP